MRHVPLTALLKLAIVAFFSFLAPAAMATTTELTVAVDIAQVQYDSAVDYLAGVRFIDAQVEIATQQAAVDEAMAVVNAGTATPAILADLATANTALAAAQVIVAPALARAETSLTRLQDAEAALVEAGAMTAPATPTELTAIEAQIAGLQMQINTLVRTDVVLAAADVELAARTSVLEAQAAESIAAWAEICLHLRRDRYLVVCEPYTP